MHDWSIMQHIDATNPPLEYIERAGRAYTSSETWVEIRKACPLKAGDVLFADWPDNKPNKNIQFKIQIALNEIGVVEAEPLLAVLNSALKLVGSIVGTFDGMHQII
jgi:hypothetical protein